MSVVETSVVIDAPPDEVWSVVADPRNLPGWDRHIVEVRGVPPDGLEQGTRYTVAIKIMGVKATVTSTVLELRPPEYSKVRLEGFLDGVVETSLEPLPDGRSKLQHRVSYRFGGGMLGQVAAEAVRSLGAGVMLKRGTLAQKRQVEQRP